MKGHVGLLLLYCCGCSGVLSAAHAALPPADADLLEFLGSVDTEDKDWHEYLARTDIDKVAQRARASGAVAAGAPPGGAGHDLAAPGAPPPGVPGAGAPAAASGTPAHGAAPPTVDH